MILYVAADLSTALAYFVIGGSLLLRRRMSFTLSPAAVVMYGAFIGLCGLSHLTMTLTLFTGVYRLDVMVRMAMMGVSVVTAWYTLIETIASNRMSMQSASQGTSF